MAARQIKTSTNLSLRFLHAQFNLSLNTEAKINIYKQIACYYENQAKLVDKVHHLRALPAWQEAHDYYAKAMKLNSQDISVCLGYARTFVMLNKYSKVLQFLRSHYEHLNHVPEFWYLFAVSHRKLGNYVEANYGITHALKQDLNYLDAIREKAIIDNLQQKIASAPLQNYELLDPGVIRSKEELDYNILSIDGGGIRGIMPAIWLSEIERFTKSPISSLFQMMSETSTGGVIVTSLSIPHQNDRSKPRYPASEIVKLYTTKGKAIFTTNPQGFSFGGLAQSKYTDEGRKKLFNAYCGESKLSQTLTEVLVTAVNSRSNGTVCFTRNEARENPAKDIKLVDALMLLQQHPLFFLHM